MRVRSGYATATTTTDSLMSRQREREKGPGSIDNRSVRTSAPPSVAVVTHFQWLWDKIHIVRASVRRRFDLFTPVRPTYRHRVACTFVRLRTRRATEIRWFLSDTTDDTVDTPSDRCRNFDSVRFSPDTSLRCIPPFFRFSCLPPSFSSLQDNAVCLYVVLKQLGVYSFSFECRKCNVVRPRETELSARFTLFTRELERDIFKVARQKFPLPLCAKVKIKSVSSSLFLVAKQRETEKVESSSETAASISRLTIHSFVTQLHFLLLLTYERAIFNCTSYTCDFCFFRVNSKICLFNLKSKCKVPLKQIL